MNAPTRWIAACATAMMLMACHSSSGGDASNTAAAMELKVYTVPASQLSPLANGLEGAFQNDKARVSASPPDKLLIYAPRNMQTSISDAIAQLAKPSPAKDNQTDQLTFHFWLLDGEPGAGADDPTLKDLATSLSALRQSIGTMHFQLKERVSGVTTYGENSGQVVTGSGHVYDFVVAGRGQTPAIHISYEDSARVGIGKMQANIIAQPGHYVLLAQAPVVVPQTLSLTNGQPSVSAPQEPPSMRLLIVRVDRINPAG